MPAVSHKWVCNGTCWLWTRWALAVGFFWSTFIIRIQDLWISNCSEASGTQRLVVENHSSVRDMWMHERRKTCANIIWWYEALKFERKTCTRDSYLAIFLHKCWPINMYIRINTAVYVCARSESGSRTNWWQSCLLHQYRHQNWWWRVGPKFTDVRQTLTCGVFESLYWMTFNFFPTCPPKILPWPEASSFNREMEAAQAACKEPWHRNAQDLFNHVGSWHIACAINDSCVYIWAANSVCLQYMGLEPVLFFARLGIWNFPCLKQESGHALAPVTVKLGGYSAWNRSRDFNRVVKLPLDTEMIKVLTCFSEL